MKDASFQKGVSNYFQRFSDNFSNHQNDESSQGDTLSYFKRFSDSFDEEEKEVNGIFQEEIIEPILEPNNGINISDEELAGALKSDTEKMESSLGVIQSKFKIFKDCKSWKDVRKKLGNAYKENIMVQTFALGVGMVISPEVIPPLKYVVGPAMIKMGYSNSKFLQKKIERFLIDDYIRIDYKKGSVSE